MTGPGDTERRLRVVIADDDPLVRRVIRSVLDRDGVVVVAEAATAPDAVDLALHYRPDVVLLDLVMPGGDSLWVLDRLRPAAGREIRVIVLAVQEDRALALRALEAGAVGWLTKDLALEELPRALKGAANGEAVVSRRLASSVVERFRELPEAGPGVRPVHSRLSSREWQVYDLLCGGAATPEIAERLGVSQETVRGHVARILRKLGVHSREDAVALAPRLRSVG